MRNGLPWNPTSQAEDTMSDNDEYVRSHCHQHCYSADWQQNQRTLNTTPKVIKRAHNDNNVLRALLTLCHTEETEHWTLDGEPSNQHQAGSSLKYDFIQMIGFRKHNMTATYMWSRHCPTTVLHLSKTFSLQSTMMHTMVNVQSPTENILL